MLDHIAQSLIDVFLIKQSFFASLQILKVSMFKPETSKNMQKYL